MADANNKAVEPNGAKTSSGLDENLAGALSYFFGFITGILFLVLEPKNKFVKFHAMQSIILSVSLGVIYFFLFFFYLLMPGVIQLMLSCILGIVGIALFVLWLFLMFKAYSGEMYKLPVIGDFAEKQAMN
jgi:uncharacterized membrane protein